jgi:hypothetical protein
LLQNKNHKLARTNRSTTINQINKWTTKALKVAMDAMEKGVTFVRKVSQIWNILLTSLSDHINDNIRSMAH